MTAKKEDERLLRTNYARKAKQEKNLSGARSNRGGQGEVEEATLPIASLVDGVSKKHGASSGEDKVHGSIEEHDNACREEEAP